MALLKIIKAGDPVLKATAKPVAKVNTIYQVCGEH